jgi:ferredoxin-NADP reductase
MTGKVDQRRDGSGGFRDLRVVAKITESSLITSFHLEAADGSELPPFRPGQFLVLKIPSGDPEGYVLRNYSLSGSPEERSRYRITVKRESAAGPSLPAGLGSGYLHDSVGVGDVVAVKGPRGEFVLEESSDRPVVMLSGGVGLTPMVSMLSALVQRSGRRGYFLHACENGDVHALRDEVNNLVGQRENLMAHYCYRRPTDQDRAARRFDSEGFLTQQLLQGLLPLDDYDFYLCGPPPFMGAMYQTLRGLGVAKARIAYEFFGPATVLDVEDKAKPVTPTPDAAPASAVGAMTIEFRKSGIVAQWDDKAQSLLAFAEEQGLQPDFSCRAGICGTCISRVISGEVTHFEEPLEDLATGELLLCCSRPKSAIVLDL